LVTVGLELLSEVVRLLLRLRVQVVRLGQGLDELFVVLLAVVHGDKYI
jgi:hypothetical protein